MEEAHADRRAQPLVAVRGVRELPAQELVERLPQVQARQEHVPVSLVEFRLKDALPLHRQYRPVPRVGELQEEDAGAEPP